MTLSSLSDLLLPPATLGLAAFLVLLLWRGRAGRGVATVLIGLLTVLGLPVVGDVLLASLDPPLVAIPAQPPPGAIVILSADVERTSVEGKPDLGAWTLERERAGARLARLTHLPILVTGGIVNVPPPVAQQMAVSLREDFNTPVRWIEDASATTWENARFSAPMLRADGIQRVYLVTHAWHMRRSLLAFRRAGMDPVPYVVRQDAPPAFDWRALVPRVSAWGHSYLAIHEWVGLLFYEWRS